MSTCQSLRMPVTANSGMSHTTYQAWIIGENSTIAANAQVSRRMIRSSRPTNISQRMTGTARAWPAVWTTSRHWPASAPTAAARVVASTPARPTGAYQMDTEPGVDMAETQPKPKPLSRPISPSRATA